MKLLSLILITVFINYACITRNADASEMTILNTEQSIHIKTICLSLATINEFDRKLFKETLCQNIITKKSKI